MRTLGAILLGAVLLFSLSAFATEIGPGPVYGHWYSSGNPYNVNGDINVPADSTLYIHEGVDVIFQGYYRLYVSAGGTFEAIGTETDSIHFFPADTSSGWRGLYFGAAVSTQHLSYCDIEYSHESGIQMQAVLLNLQVSHSTIAHCRAVCGGGIHVRGLYSTLDISHSTIAYNTAESDTGGKGGGIYLCFGTLVMDSCTVHANRAVIPTWDYYHTVRGGGIYIGQATVDVIISGSSITDNFIGLSNGGRSQGVYPPDRGGGIFNGSENPVTISDCLVSGNRANVDFRSGGGIASDLYSYSTTLSRCDISNNWTPTYAGGYETEGNSNIVDCTFSGNHNYAIICGLGGDACSILNTIVAHNGTGIYHYVGSSTLSARFSDIIDDCQGMPSGFGVLDRVNYNGDSCDVYYNIFLDPAFVGPYNQDCNLRWRSPCIDAGDPNSPLDPDNTVCDMGRYYFNQDAMAVVELYPHDEPIVIPPQGGRVFYDGWVFNFLGQRVRADIWSYAFVPGIGRYGPLDLYRNVPIPADSIGKNNIRQNVPGLAPEGDYTIVAYVGRYPSTITDSSYFYFSKSGSVAGGIAGWFEGDEWLKVGDLAESNLPGVYALSQNYPNPFNAATTIHYQLPLDTDVKLEVYNLLGEKVATLVNERQEAGYKSVIWDASEISSGVYFYKLTTGDYTETKRMMLVK